MLTWASFPARLATKKPRPVKQKVPANSTGSISKLSPHPTSTPKAIAPVATTTAPLNRATRARAIVRLKTKATVGKGVARITL